MNLKGSRQQHRFIDELTQVTTGTKSHLQGAAPNSTSFDSAAISSK